MKRLRHDRSPGDFQLWDSDLVVEGWEDDVIARLDAQALLRRAMGILSPGERKAVFNMLYDRPVVNESDKQARKRARAKLRNFFRQHDTF